VSGASQEHRCRARAWGVIAFLDSDDWWLPQKLEKSMEYFERGADSSITIFTCHEARSKALLRKSASQSSRNHIRRPARERQRVEQLERRGSRQFVGRDRWFSSERLDRAEDYDA